MPMESHSAIAMFISEIPVRFHEKKTIKWVRDLTSRTTAQDVIQSVLPSGDTNEYSLYIRTSRHREILDDQACIYKVVASYNQQRCARRLLFEIRSKESCHSKKRVRFADEIIVQNIQGRCVSNENCTSNMVETVSIPIEKRLEKLRESFRKQVQQKQDNYVKLSSLIAKRESLKVINENIPKPVCVQKATIRQISRSSSESGISSSSSTDDFTASKIVLETLV